MLLLNKARTRNLLGLGNRKVVFCVSSLCRAMKHSGLESDNSMTTKKQKLGMEIDKVDLSLDEMNLRALLLDVAQAVDESKKHQEKLVLRFAGGWVRDKLLDIPSNDIDVAINSMTGSCFTEHMREYLADEKNLEKHNLNAIDFGRYYKTAANPEKSKHLETSTMTILGYDIDFVNLRKESYSEASRNPRMEFGTPKDDALRRDCTINALFYNIHTDEVEDYVGGLEDLRGRCIKTPLDPKITFLDDPLRILRLIRFANRLNFKFEPECEAFLNDYKVLRAFNRKISRERVQVEIFKMFKGENPRGALEIFDRLGLYLTIFMNPETISTPKLDLIKWRYAYNCLEKLLKKPYFSQTLVQCNSETVWLLAAYAPWSTLENFPTNSDNLAAEAARKALKVDNKKMNLISNSIKNYQQIIDLKDSILRRENWIYHRDVLGKLIRKWDLHGNWRLQIIFAILVEAMRLEISKDDTNSLCRSFETLFHDWEIFLSHLQKIDIMDASSIKNLVDGRILGEALGLKPGKWVGQISNFCMDWTLCNPGADKTKLIEEIKRRRDELKIPKSD